MLHASLGIGCVHENVRSDATLLEFVHVGLHSCNEGFRSIFNLL